MDYARTEPAVEASAIAACDGSRQRRAASRERVHADHPSRMALHLVDGQDFTSQIGRLAKVSKAVGVDRLRWHNGKANLVGAVASPERLAKPLGH